MIGNLTIDPSGNKPSKNNIKNVIQQMIDDGKSDEFIKDFVAVWTKVMNADRPNLKKLN